MTQQIPFSNTSVNKAMNHEQLTQVIEAILAGKYSWACVLLLRSVGYNPLHYIPYRTYNRLLKENCQSGSQKRHQADIVAVDKKCFETRSSDLSTQHCLSSISDLSHLEVFVEQSKNIRGGNLDQLLDIKLREGNSLRVSLLSFMNQKSLLKP